MSFDHGLGGQCRAAGSPGRLGCEVQLSRGDIDSAAGAISDRAGSAHLRAGICYGQVGIAIDRKDQTLVLTEIGVVAVVGVDGIVFGSAVENQNSEGTEGNGAVDAVVGSCDVAGIGTIEAKSHLGEGAIARCVERYSGYVEHISVAGSAVR